MIKLPEKVKYIIETITEAGFEAYAVGGCVRDSVLGREPDDWDITTSASPYQIKELFPRTVDTGIRHGTVTVMLDKDGYEVTTYRIDGVYEDGRHPREVTFTPDLKEDLKRRDFTMNAMAYNGKTGLIDIFDGRKDMENRIIRCVGDPEERFREDALRMMRAVRFSAQLGYEIEAATETAITHLAENLKKISAERIQVELLKLLCSPYPGRIRSAYELGITKIILPEFDSCMETAQNNPHHCYTVGEHSIRAMEAVEPDKCLRLAMLFHDIGKPATKTTDQEGIDHFHGHPLVSEEMTRKILKRLKLDNQTIFTVTRLVRYHDHYIGETSKAVRRSILEIGEEIFPLLLQVKRADIEAQSEYLKKEKEEHLETVQKLYEDILRKKQCVSLKELAVSGSDLIRENGMQPGKEVGEVLSCLLNLVIEDPALNQKETLLERAKSFGNTL